MERNAAFVMAHNQLDLTRSAVSSILSQDISPIHLLLINNGSTDGTLEYFTSLAGEHDGHLIETLHYTRNESPVRLSNMAMHHFYSLSYPMVLGVANDSIIPPNFYRICSAWPRGVITASMTTDRSFPTVPEAHAVNECTPMAVTIIRKWLYDALTERDGYFFDESFFLYASDCDFALRLSSMGIRGIQLDVPYYHYGSSTWKLASEEEQRWMLQQADRDRAYFVRKWGFTVDSYEYGQCPHDLQFMGIPRRPPLPYGSGVEVTNG